MGYPRGLIRYDSEANLELPTPGQPKLHWKRLKIIGWGAAMLIMTAALINSVGQRSSIDAAVQQVRQPLYVMLSDGNIRNRYQVRITNKSTEDEVYAISAKGIPAQALDMGNFSEVQVHTGKSLIIQASVSLPPKLAENTHNFEFIVTPKSNPENALHLETRFDFKHE